MASQSKIRIAKESGVGVTWPRGFRAAGGTCGIKPSGSPDLALIAADAPCTAAGVFTTNRLPGAPVTVSKAHVAKGRARAIVCNSGCSNVATGAAGVDDAHRMCRAAADCVGCDPAEVLVCSTGVIGHRLPMAKILPGIAQVATQLTAGAAADAHAARCIMTTDLVPKLAARSVKVAGKTVRLGGIAKGSGMIAPNLATMLVFITTDAAVAAAPLRAALQAAARATFNRMSVDMDTSTSDTVLALASGLAGNAKISAAKGAGYDAFAAALRDLCADLTYQLVKDGEGATKVFRVLVCGARDEKEADRVGKTLVDSPLLKSAVHGGDPNWGRLIAAVGRSGVPVTFDTLALKIAGVAVFKDGEPAVRSAPQQNKLDEAMQAKEVTFTIDLGRGPAHVEWLGCDLSEEYVKINADYTT